MNKEVCSPYGEQNKKTRLPGWYRGFKTCPTSCPYSSGGCYARSGHVSIWARKDDANGATTEHMLNAASACIEVAKKKGYPAVRANVSGDFRNSEEIEALLQLKIKSNWDGFLFGYTSLDVSDALLLKCRKSNFVIRRSHSAKKWGTVVVPDAETAKNQKLFVCPGNCAKCGVCWKSSIPVAFVAHGSGTKKAIANSPFLKNLKEQT